MVVACGLLLVMPAVAMAAPPQPVVDALALLAAGSSRLAAGWRYQQQVTSDQGSETLAYDAAHPVGARWKVLTVNGKQPSPKKARTLANKMRAAHKKGKQSGGVSLSMGSWLQASRYRLIHATGVQLVYQIEMHAGTHDSASADKMFKHLSGRLVVARSDHRPLELMLDNFESFSPRFGVKVTRFRLQIHFRRLGVNGPVVADRVSTVAQGKVFWVKRFKTKAQVTLSHFAPVAASASAPAGH